MTVLTADSQLPKWRIAVKSLHTWNWLRLPAVTRKTVKKYRPAESVIQGLVTWRETPLLNLRIIRQGRLEEIIATPDDEAVTVDTRTDHVFQFLRCLKDRFPGSVQFIFGLVRTAALAVYLKMSVQLSAKQNYRSRDFLQLQGVARGGHRAAHGRRPIPVIDIRMANGATA
jgi:hypothetical protein